MKKKIIRNSIIFLVLGMIILGGTIIYATSYYANNTTYNNTTSGLSTANVSDTLDKLYSMCVPRQTVVEYVTNTYKGATQTDVTTAGGEAIKQATSVNLMEDSFGNIRYYGANPYNYVTFNDELWRIIGVFDVDGEYRVKLIRNESIGNREYDSSSELLNDYYKSELNVYLNGTYYNGLSDIAKRMIISSTWNLGGSSVNNGLYSDDFYNLEKSSTVYSGHHTAWTGNIAIIYPSDYGYATDLNLCKQPLDKYNNSICKSNDWLGTDSYQWTISPNSHYYYVAFYIKPDGSVYDGDGADTVDLNMGVRPSVYLKADVQIDTSGKDGSSTNPYS